MLPEWWNRYLVTLIHTYLGVMDTRWLVISSTSGIGKGAFCLDGILSLLMASVTVWRRETYMYGLGLMCLPLILVSSFVELRFVVFCVFHMGF